MVLQGAALDCMCSHENIGCMQVVVSIACIFNVEVSMSVNVDILKKAASEKTRMALDTDCPLWPYLNYYAYRMERQLAAVAGVSLDEKKIVLNGFLESLALRVMNAASNVLISERAILAETLEREVSSEEYFELLRSDKYYLDDVLSAYPELDRVLLKMADNYIDFTVDFLVGLAADRSGLCSIASVGDQHSVVECVVSEGETHKSSRAVVIVTFSNFEKVVYKPRDLYVESAMSDVLAYMCARASSPYSDWIIPKYLLRGRHGWAQYTGQKDAERGVDISLFYLRMVFLLGFCTSITATDITSDNVIAHGAHPVPVDLETVFYSVLTQANIPKEVRWNASQTSILPNWTWKGADGIGVDLSAIGGLEEQYVSINFYQHIQEDSEDRFGVDGVKVFPSANVLYFEGKPCSPWLYENEIREGFKRYFEMARVHVDYLLSKIDELRGVCARYVPRSTATYHYAVQCSLHPVLMSSSESRRSFLKKILSSDTPPATGFLESEVSACMELDIPYAQMTLGEHTFVEPVYGGRGYLDKEQFQDGISHSIEYIVSMSKQRMEFELDLISNSLVALKSMYDHQRKLTEHLFRQSDEIVGLDEVDVNILYTKISSACAENLSFINARLKKELKANGVWLGFHASPGGYMEYSELGDDFYYGLSGILYSCTVASLYVEMPESTLVGLANLCYIRVKEKLDHIGCHIGGFHFGLASTIVPLYLSLSYLKDIKALCVVEGFKKYLRACLKDDWWAKYFWGADLLSGSCGCLVTITKLYELTADIECRELACVLFEKIHSERMVVDGEVRISFGKSITVRADGLLSGLSHGVMGCAYSLFYYNQVVAKDPNVASVFLSLLAWELGEFNCNIQNWEDYRKRAGSTQGEFAWSHGLPGNYLAIHYFAQNGVEIAMKFIEAHPAHSFFSFEKLIGRKRPVNDSLCHGSYGLLNIIKQLSPDVIVDGRIYFWANLPNFCDQDTRELRVRTADSLGLWVGKTGAILGAIGLLDAEYKFPFLPHQMDYIR